MYTSNMAVRAAIQELRSYGVDVETLLVEEGLKLPDSLEVMEKVPLETTQRFLQLVLRVTGDPCFGLSFTKFVHPTSFGPLSVTLMSSFTLRDFCQRLSRYYAFISTNHVLVFEESGDEARLIVRKTCEVDPEVQRVLEDAVLSMVLHMIRFMYREDYTPCKVEQIAEAIPGREQDYEAFFGVPVYFSSQETAIYFNREDLDIPMPASNPELSKINERQVIEILAKMNTDDLSSQVYGALLELLPGGRVEKEDVAERFAMTLEVFDEELALGSTSFQSLLDKARRDLAQLYLDEGKSVSEIACLLGYSNSSNFTRAYKRWTGNPPSINRQPIPRD
jgi:AraC-like DNA-binding protein